MATVARTPDAELLRRLRARDRTAWEVLYLEYQPRLRAFAYRLAGNVHDADDLVQETFVRAVPRLDRLDPETTDVSAYLFATLKNLFLKQVERRKRQEPMAEVPEPAVPQPIEDDPQRSLLLRSQQDEVRLANAHLQPRQRLVLALRELEDRSYAEIGEIVGHEGERGRAAHLPCAREPAHRASARPGRPGAAPRGVPPLPAAPRRPSRRPAQGQATRRDARAPRRLRALPGRPRGHAGGVASLPHAVPAAARRG